MTIPDKFKTGFIERDVEQIIETEEGQSMVRISYDETKKSLRLYVRIESAWVSTKMTPGQAKKLMFSLYEFLRTESECTQSNAKE